MVLAVSVVGALLVLAYCFVWRFKAKREAKKRVQTLFETKKDLGQA
jgi:hypothetical protein